MQKRFNAAVPLLFGLVKNIIDGKGHHPLGAGASAEGPEGPEGASQIENSSGH